MTGRSLHDTLLRVLSHGPLRAQLLDADDDPTAITADEWRILRRVPKEHVRNMARFLARHYYGERIARLFRHIRRLALQTGRDPLSVLDSPEARLVLDHAVLGSSDTAEEMVSLLETFLLEDAGEIQARFPYWRDLVRYQATMFRIEARKVEERGTDCPRRSASGNIEKFEWDIPAILADLQSSSYREAQAAHGPSMLLIASTSDGHVISLRCTLNVQRLFEAADGTRTIEELGLAADCSVQQTERVLRQMKEIGAIQWDDGITTSS
ncbi:MAG TPA: hypothetical protein VJV04_03135 [Nitrospiraceae bacterium]|nr:hypothetical protein [Nitrospiraceae bacterium]